MSDEDQTKEVGLEEIEGKETREHGTKKHPYERSKKEALMEDKRYLRSIVEVLPDIIIRTNREGVYLDVLGPEEELAMPKKELLGKNMKDVLPDHVANRVMKAVEKSIKENCIQTVEYKLPVPAGDLWFEARIVASGKDEAFAYIRNITDRKKAEEALRENEERYRSIFESAKDAIFVMKDDRFIDCNQKTLEIFNCSRDEIIQEPPYKFSPETQPDGRDSKEKALEKIHAALAGKPQTFQWVHTTKDGKPFYTEVSLNKYTVDGEEFLMAIVRDITKRKQAEEKLTALHTWAQKLNRATTMEKIFEYTLDAMEQTLGFARATIQLKKETSLTMEAYRGYESLPQGILKLPLDGPGITVKVANTGKSILVNDVTKHQAYIISKPEIKSELAVPITVGGQVLGVVNAESKEVSAFDSEDVRCLETLAAHVGVAMKELREREKRVSLQRLDELRNQFIAMAAHEINTPLTPIKSNLEMMKRGYFGELTGEQERKIKETLESVDRMVRLVDDFRRSSKLRTEQITVNMQKHDLADTIEETLAKYKHALTEENLMLIKHIEQPITAVYDEDRLMQVLRNLVENAIDYTEDTIWIETEVEQGHIRISVRDNGHGIPEAEQAKIFQPFYRVEDEGRSREERRFGGTGLGLSICKRIVEAHGGEIQVDSKRGEGSTFTVILPKNRNVEAVNGSSSL